MRPRTAALQQGGLCGDLFNGTILDASFAFTLRL